MISWEFIFQHPLRNDGIEGARRAFDEAPLERGMLVYMLARVQGNGSARPGCEVPLWPSNRIYVIHDAVFSSVFLFFSFGMRGRLERVSEFYG